MNTEKFVMMQVSNLMIDTVKKDIKNMHLGVYPPNGRVRIAAPLTTADDTIRLFVISRFKWIRKQQRRFLEQERQTKREYVSGESHYLFGKRYRLNVINTDTQSKIDLRNRAHIDLYVRADATSAQKEIIVERFYRSELKKLIPTLLKRWQKKLGVQTEEIKIKKMKTKWGTCNSDDRRIWLNLELAKKPIHCIDYVFVHELCHLIEKKHSDRFTDALESAIPSWKYYKDELNQTALSYWKWDC